jgi:PAS domain-containing protein
MGPPGLGVLPIRLFGQLASRHLRSAVVSVIGGIGPALLTLICFNAKTGLATTALIYLLFLAVLSLMGSITAPILVSFAAVGCLDYFFAKPLFSFHVDYQQNALFLALAAFLTTSILVSGLRVTRKWTQDTLHESQLYLTEAQTLSHPGSFGWHPVSGTLIWSDETFRIFGCERAETPSLDLVLERTHPEDRPRRVRALVTCASREAEDWDLEHRLLIPDGSVKQIRIVAHATPAPNGDPRFIGTVMDITVARRAEEEWRQA